MSKPACPEDEFIRLFKELGPAGTAKELKISVRNVFSRRKTIENRNDISLKAPENVRSNRWRFPSDGRILTELENGTILIGSDAHYWPGLVSTAHRGIVHLANKMKPDIFVLNGDVADGALISRHPSSGFSPKPKVREEFEAIEDRLHEIDKACPKARKIWTMGNHDMRFEARLAQQASEFEGVNGFLLKEHFPNWEHCLALWVNDDLVIKHRFKGGVHATHNNAVNSGKSMATGHLHSLKVTPFDDYNGTRFGIDSGTLADPAGPQFEYGEDNPMNHRSGFIVLTFRNGMLMWPEICRVVDQEHIDFRGELIKV